MKKPVELPVLNDSNQASGLPRRRLLQGLVASAGAGMALPGLAAGQPGAPHVHAAVQTDAQAKLGAKDWQPEFLDEHQFATLTALCARIVPGSDKGFADRYIDSLLAVDTPEHKQRFSTAIGALDGASRDKFGKPFRGLLEAQQDEVLTLASTGESSATDWVWTPGTPVAPPSRGPRSVTLRDHFEHVKGAIVNAHYSSELGLKELGYTGQMFFTEFPNCTHSEHT